MRRVVWSLLTVFLLMLAGAAQAKLTPMFSNSDFEMGDLTNWHTTGQCWEGDAPTVGDPWSNAPQGRWFAVSTAGGPPYAETLTGHLISSPFIVPSGVDIAAFFIAGWADPNIRVEFKKASDNSVLFVQQVPSTSATPIPVKITGFNAYAGQSIYIEVIDENVGGDPNATSGWIGVDDFEWSDGAGVTPPDNPNRLFLNSDFETGDLTNWTGNGVALNHNPTTGYPWGNAPEHTYCLCSVDNGAIKEIETGTLTSIPFNIPAGKDIISYYMAGYLDSGIRVEFRKTSDNSVIATGQMPATASAFSKIYVSGFAAYAGQSIYIVVIDDNRHDSEVTNDWYGWLMVDDFEWASSTKNPNLLFENSDFENGDLTNWSYDDLAWSHDPTKGYPWGATPEGQYCLVSTGSGDPESFIGTLTSVPFTVPSGKDAIKFYIAGWADPVNQRVEFHKASDNSIIVTKAMAGTSSNFTEVMVRGFSAYAGQQIYIKVVDNYLNGDPNAANGWFGVDGFQWGVITLGPQNANRCFDNAGFELSDYSNWNQSDGSAFSTNPMAGNGFYALSAEGNYSASSAAMPGTGKLTSNAFKMAKPGIGFAIAGWNHPACMVNLRLADDNSLVDSVQPAFNMTFWHGAVFNGWTAWGKQVYIEVVDNIGNEDVKDENGNVTGTNQPWIGADDFHFIEGSQVPVELSTFSAD